MNFDDFDLSTFDIDSQLPTYKQVNDDFKSQKKDEDSKTKESKKKQQSQSNDDEENSFNYLNGKHIVSPIMSGQFEPFSNFFITITTIQNIDNCANRSLFLKIRIHPSIPIIESPCAWCSNRDAVFNVAYSLDFTRIAPFNLGDFTPVVELYRRFNSSNDLIAVTLLPLKTIKEVMKCGSKNRYLTYLYRDSPVTLRDLSVGSSLGCMKVTVAFGFPEHERLLDPNSKNVLTPNLFYTSQIPNGTDYNNQYQQNIVKPNPIPVQIENISQNIKYEQSSQEKIKQTDKKRVKQVYEYDDESDDDYRHHHRSRHSSRHDRNKRSKKKDDFNWVDEAISLGWKPPGSSDFDWKAKAKEKGWKAPNEAIMSDIGVYVDPNGNNMKEFRTSVGIQTDEVQNQILILPEQIEEEEEATTTNSIEDLELIELLNPKLKKNQQTKTKIKDKQKNQKANKSVEKPNQIKKNLLISEPQSYSEEVEDDQKNKTKPKQLNFVKCITLFEESPNQEFLDTKLDEDEEEDKIETQDIQRMLKEISQTSNLVSFKQNSINQLLINHQISDSEKMSSTDSTTIKNVDSDDLTDDDNIVSKPIEHSTVSSINQTKESSNEIKPIDHEEILKSTSALISDSDSDDISVSDINHMKSLAMNDKEFYEIYSKYLD